MTSGRDRGFIAALQPMKGDKMETVTNTEEFKKVFGKQISKVDAYKWKLKDEMGTMKNINKQDLCIEPSYQRDAIVPKILELASNWSWISCGAITVGLRDGRYWVIDGQHRVLAAKRRTDIKELPCVVFQIGDIVEEAVGFINANTNRKAIRVIDKWRALIVAGDALAIAVRDMLIDIGLTPVWNANHTNQIKCIGAVLNYAQIDFDATAIVLRTAKQICNRDNGLITDYFVHGLWYINKNIEGGLNSKRLIDRLKSVTCQTLYAGIYKAKAYYARGGGRVYAEGMLVVINKGLQNKFTLIDINNVDFEQIRKD